MYNAGGANNGVNTTRGTGSGLGAFCRESNRLKLTVSPFVSRGGLESSLIKSSLEVFQEEGELHDEQRTDCTNQKVRPHTELCPVTTFNWRMVRVGACPVHVVQIAS